LFVRLFGATGAAPRALSGVRIWITTRGVLFAAMLATVSCSNRARSPEPVPRRATQTASPPRPAPADDEACKNVEPFHRETLRRGVETVITGDGDKAIFRGRSWHHYDDGKFDVLLDVVLFAKPWLPDARDRRAHAFGSHCVRIVSSDDDNLVIDIGSQPQAPTPWRCAIACCGPGQSRTPDGTDECCICPDVADR
jgi:hypothetical protein